MVDFQGVVIIVVISIVIGVAIALLIPINVNDREYCTNNIPPKISEIIKTGEQLGIYVSRVDREHGICNYTFSNGL